MSDRSAATKRNTTAERRKALQRLEELIESLNKESPSEEDVSELRDLFRENPGMWKMVSAAQNAADRMVSSASEDPRVQAVLWANYEGVKRELGYVSAPGMDRLLIEHVALCWLRLQCLEQRYGNVMHQSITLVLAQHYEKRLSATQQRYLRACQSLARIRKMNLPALQVNIATDGGQQVNVQGEVVVRGKGNL